MVITIKKIRLEDPIEHLGLRGSATTPEDVSAAAPHKAESQIMGSQRRSGCYYWLNLDLEEPDLTLEEVEEVVEQLAVVL